MGLKYFFDTYAIVELISGNPNFAKYINEPFVLTIFNLSELYYFALREYNNDADKIFEKYKQGVAKINDEILKEAMKFRKNNKSKDLSYADCIGYVYALKNNLIFLTGDRQFEKMKNVEFVK